MPMSLPHASPDKYLLNTAGLRENPSLLNSVFTTDQKGGPYLARFSRDVGEAAPSLWLLEHRNTPIESSFHFSRAVNLLHRGIMLAVSETALRYSRGA
jgi:hypothetical protein